MNPWQKLVQFFQTFGRAFAAMRRGRIWIPFLLYGIVEGLLLAFVYYGVRPPFTDFFAGPLSFLVPEPFFHYPVHLALIPAVFYRMLIPFGALLESLLLAAATLMFVQLIRGVEVPRWRDALAQVKANYLQFVIFWILSFLLIFAFQKYYALATADLWVGYSKRRVMVDIADFCGSAMMNCLFAYSTAVIVVEGTNIAKTFTRSLRVFGGSLIYTMLFVIFGSILTYPFSYMMQNATDWMGRFNPEVMILLVAGNIVVGMIASFIGIATLTFWYVFRQESA